jgi:predicted nucleotidyltransferase
METFMEAGKRILDLDHLVRKDGRIYRVVGNLDIQTHFLGYNVYSPSTDGDRLYRGERYKKNFIEDDNLPTDALDTYELVALKDVTEHHEPVRSARLNSVTFQSTVWFDLYTELARIFGDDSVGIFGSSMFGLHLTPEGNIRKDIDFVIQGIANVAVLRQQIPKIREKLGFATVTVERQLQQYDRYQRIFRNQNNSIRSIIARRWTGLQLSEQVVTTIRLRDPALTIPTELVTAPTKDLHDIVISGRVTDADSSNLFPRKFSVITEHESMDIYILWWKFSTPVRDGDAVTVCGSVVTVDGHPAVRLTDFTQHWLKIEN